MPKLVRQVLLYSEQHEVSTLWGHFLLDDAAYADYLEGKLWINWGTDSAGTKSKSASSPKPYIPLNISDEAVRLRDAAAHQDMYLFLQQRFPGASVPLPYKSRMKDRGDEPLSPLLQCLDAGKCQNLRMYKGDHADGERLQNDP